MKQQKSWGERLFCCFNYIFMTLFGLIMLVPLLTVTSTSLSSPHAVSTGKVFLFPVDFTLASWKYILGLDKIWRSILLTAAVTVIGTALSGNLKCETGEEQPVPYIFLTTYNLASDKYTDHGIIQLEDGRYPTLTQSIAVHPNGMIYTCPWIPRTRDSVYDEHKQQCDLISFRNPLRK